MVSISKIILDGLILSAIASVFIVVRLIRRNPFVSEFILGASCQHCLPLGILSREVLVKGVMNDVDDG